MRRSVLFFLSLVLVASMLLAACGTAAPAPAATQAPAQKTVLNVWSFTNEIRTMAIAFEGKHPDVDVVYTMIPMTNGEYQTEKSERLHEERQGTRARGVCVDYRFSRASRHRSAQVPRRGCRQRI